MDQWLAECWNDYQLLDSGDGDKLERIGGYMVQRPCPQAIWSRQLSADEWKKAQSVCHRQKDGGGQWEHPTGEPKNLQASWQGIGVERALNFSLRFTAFGHCGVFFEQAIIWQRLFDAVVAFKEQLGRTPKMVNLFAYTGCASIVMAAAGAEVFHVDSAKGVLNWGKESLALNSDIAGSIKWIHDDARSFVQFSQKREFMYDGILVDPPSWGHGVKKEKWDFGDDIASFITDLLTLVQPEHGLCLLTSHTHGVQAEALKNILAQDADSREAQVDCGELGIVHANDQRVLPAGIFAQLLNSNT
ncbi:MAG: class I SAM-dependent methyltransferase [Planctomycetes bacterium]|nr:class I SAM-dependent methyltransferase [Planctomycetota bacterium]